MQLSQTVDHGADESGVAGPAHPTGDSCLVVQIGPRTTPHYALAVAPVVDVVVPVFNEESTLQRSVQRLHAYLSAGLPFSWRITIADNASTDGTWERAVQLAGDLDHVVALHLDRQGRGLALRTAWARSDASVVAYMDVDLSTGLDALLPLIAPLVSGHSDVAVGSRLAPGARVARGPRREFISRSYNTLLRAVFASKVHDAQCGFKAVRADVAHKLLPAIVDDGWFFDTELLLLADHNGLRIHEVPVDWVDDPDSRVHMVSTALGDLAGSARMAHRFLTGRGQVDLGDARRTELSDDMGRPLVTFAMIGSVSTAISLVIFLALRSVTGAVAANLVALAATFGANAWAHARFVTGSRRVRWGLALATFAVGATLSTAALVAADALGAPPGVAVVAVLGTWLATSVVRLTLLQSSAR